MTVAALLPQHWEFRLVDENVRPLRDGDLGWADIVLTGSMLTQQKGSLKIIKRAHDQGKPVVVGGPDPTSQPRVYREADFLVLGEGEVSMAALYVHYSSQSAFVIRTLEDRIAYVESYGEESYNQSMVVGQSIRVDLERDDSYHQKTGSGEGIAQPAATSGVT
jgi:hypothetical protein